jgi:hypothetical protein
MSLQLSLTVHKRMDELGGVLQERSTCRHRQSNAWQWLEGWMERAR